MAAYGCLWRIKLAANMFWSRYPALMKFALNADQRIEATPNAVCSCCDTEMIAKCGIRWCFLRQIKTSKNSWARYATED